MTTNRAPLSFVGPQARGIGAVRAVGEGLGPIIGDGDVVFVNTRRIPWDGDIVLVSIDGKLTLKVYRELDGEVWFEYGQESTAYKLAHGIYGLLGVAVRVSKDLPLHLRDIPMVGTLGV